LPGQVFSSRVTRIGLRQIRIGQDLGSGPAGKQY
jgi:hypothetical protein